MRNHTVGQKECSERTRPVKAEESRFINPFPTFISDGYAPNGLAAELARSYGLREELMENQDSQSVQSTMSEAYQEEKNSGDKMETLKKRESVEPMGTIQDTADNDRRVRSRKERFIPLDIIIDILSRLPGSTLLRFRLVCKLWSSLTYDTRLVDLHLDHASKVEPPHIIIFSRDEKHFKQKFHLTVLDETWKPKYKVTRDSDGLLCTPPTNGLICLYDFHRNITLCNPMTQEFLPLPRPTHDNKGIANGFPRCAFGFHPVTKEYKVVRFFYHHLNHKTETYILGCEVFTLGGTSWKYIGNIRCYPTGEGINLNGTIYWSTGAKRIIPDQIIGFDLKDEKFRTIFPPVFASYQVQESSSVFLVQLEGKLCLVHALSQPPSLDVWTLEDYTKSLWIHRCCIPMLFNRGHSNWHPEPIIIHKGRILLRCFDSLSYYDLQGESTEQMYNNNCLSSSAKVYSYVESLVSLGNNKLLGV